MSGDSLPLLDYLDKTFFDHSCADVASSLQARLIAEKNPDLCDCIHVHQSQIAQHGLVEVCNLTGYSTLKSELRQQMVLNAGMMIREHFEKRLRLYVLIIFSELGSDLTKKQAKEKESLVNVIMRAWKSTNETDVMKAMQMRDILTPDDTDWS